MRPVGELLVAQPAASREPPHKQFDNSSMRWCGMWEATSDAVAASRASEVPSAVSGAKRRVNQLPRLCHAVTTFDRVANRVQPVVNAVVHRPTAYRLPARRRR